MRQCHSFSFIRRQINVDVSVTKFRQVIMAPNGVQMAVEKIREHPEKDRVFSEWSTHTYMYPYIGMFPQRTIQKNLSHLIKFVHS